MRPPAFDQDLSFFQTVEYLSVQELVSQLAVKAIIVAVFPGRAWCDEESFDVPLAL